MQTEIIMASEEEKDSLTDREFLRMARIFYTTAQPNMNMKERGLRKKARKSKQAHQQQFGTDSAGVMLQHTAGQRIRRP